MEPFTATLRSDLEYAGAFSVTDPAHYPSATEFRDPTTPESADRWLGTGAEVLVDTRGEVAGDRVSVEARVWDLKSRKLILGRKYSGGASYVERIAHTLANDLVKYFTGKSGVFLSTILFVSDQGGVKEIGAMDFDGRGVASAHLAQVDLDQPERRGRPDRVHVLRAPVPADLDDGPRRRRQAGDLDRDRAERLAVALARRQPDRVRRIGQGQQRHLHDRRGRRQRAPPPHDEPRPRGLPRLVADGAPDPLHLGPRRGRPRSTSWTPRARAPGA